MSKDNYIVYKWDTFGNYLYLMRHVKKEEIITQAKKWAEHGNLVDKENAENGYHGRCCNCGLALVTDLGYMSWEGTTCEIKEHKEIKEIITIKWTKHLKRATRLNISEASLEFSRARNKQGWGEYCFGYKTAFELTYNL